MTDNFLEAVEENLRSDRYRELFRKYLPWAIGVSVVLILAAGAFWGYSAYRKSEAEKGATAYAAGLKAAQSGDADTAFARFGEAAKTHTSAYKPLALMGQGAIRLGQNKPEEAVALFDKAADATRDPVLKDAARLKSAFALMDTAPMGAIEERLTPLTGDKRPFRMMAREALGVARLKAGKTQEARADFVVLTLAPGVPEGMRERAQTAIELIDSGAAGSLPQIAKAIGAAQQAAMASAGPAQAPQAPQTPRQTPQDGAAQ